jgi:putative ABC transport system permease protein
MNLASKDIRHNLGRFTLTTLGIGMLLMVVMGMGGIYRGIVEDAVLLVEQIDADLWIVQRGTRGPFAEISRVPANLIYRAEAVPGVEDAREFVYHTIQRESEGKPLRMAVLGLSWPTDRGEWVPLVSGRTLAQNHFEMIADASLGLRLGQRVSLGKETYTVVGLCEGMLSSGGDGIAFVTVADAQAIQFELSGEATRLERASRRVRGERAELGTLQPSLVEQATKPSAELAAIGPPALSAVMIRVAPGARAEEVATIVSGWADVSIHSRQSQRELLLEGSVEKVRRQIGLFRILLTLIAGVIMALILYTLTLDKLHAIALLKLIGASNRVILALILQQALALGLLGFGLAYLLGRWVFPAFPRRVILMQEDLLQLGLIVVVISVVSSVLGIGKALRVSPNEALS